jgi:HEPN domain-containing protein
LVLEKILKALYVQANNNQLPPKTHNLIKLARRSNLNLTKEQEIFLDEVNDFNLEVRYPQYKNEFHKKCTKKFTANYYQKINEMMIWLKSQIE